MSPRLGEALHKHSVLLENRHLFAGILLEWDSSGGQFANNRADDLFQQLGLVLRFLKTDKGLEEGSIWVTK